MLVLAADPSGCVGVDLDSGAFVRASYTPAAVRPPELFDIVTGRIGDASQPLDVSRPESLRLEAPPVVDGQMSPRKAARWLDPLVHPRRGPVLGFSGRAVPYWTLAGDRPSLTLLDVASAPHVRLAEGGYECRFTWQTARHQYPLGDRRLATQLEAVGWPRYSGRELHRLLGWKVRRLLVVLTPPHEGYCYKVVAALLPAP
jgi:hypothetical protein